MRNARSRVEKLEREDWENAPIKFIFTGKSLARGEKPGPGAFTLVLDDPGARANLAGEPEDDSPEARA